MRRYLGVLPKDTGAASGMGMGIGAGMGMMIPGMLYKVLNHDNSIEHILEKRLRQLSAMSRRGDHRQPLLPPLRTPDGGDSEMPPMQQRPYGQ